jgi:NAD kinase
VILGADDGTSMGFQWDFHEFYWDFNGISMGFSMGFQWDFLVGALEP